MAELNLKEIAQNAKKTSYVLSSLDSEFKNMALLAVAENIEKNSEVILHENRVDLEAANKLLNEDKLTKSLYNRLKLDDEKIRVMVEGIRDVSGLEDPVNKTQWAMELDKGLELYRVSCPIGVIGVIFEARPEVVPQIASLAIKSSNSVILKGGSEAHNSNQILINLINEALDSVNFPKNAINLIKTRHDVQEMLKLDDCIDLVIPRGSNELVKHIQSNTRIPVLGHADGVCHVFVDESADLKKAVNICVDSKVQYPAACNAVETILVHKNVADKFLPELVSKLKNNKVKVKGDKATLNITEGIDEAIEEDWGTEYCDLIVSIKIADNLNDAINHINSYGSGHTDSIVTENKGNVNTFMNLVNSAGVYHNVSTRFSDGFRYGFGAEVGISTNKTHARGPVGLEGLVIYKYKLFGNGQIVAEYSGDNAKKYTHKRIGN